MTRSPASAESPESSDASRGSTRPAASGRRRRVIWAAAVALLLLGGLGRAWGVMLRVEKNGRTTEITIPEGSKANVSEDGNVDVKLPPTPVAAPSATPAAALSFGPVIERVLNDSQTARAVRNQFQFRKVRPMPKSIQLKSLAELSTVAVRKMLSVMPQSITSNWPTDADLTTQGEAMARAEQ